MLLSVCECVCVCVCVRACVCVSDAHQTYHRNLTLRSVETNRLSSEGTLHAIVHKFYYNHNTQQNTNIHKVPEEDVHDQRQWYLMFKQTHIRSTIQPLRRTSYVLYL